MLVEFYWISGSPFAWRVHLALEHKGIPYRSHLLKASEGEHKTPEFLKLNPRGRVPVLRDGETVIYESVAILAYLELRQPDPPLFGSSQAEAGHVWQRVQEIENYARNPFLHVAIAVLGGTFGDKPDEAHDLIDLCCQQLDWIDGLLADQAWIAGAELSAADFVFYPVWMMFRRTIGTVDTTSFGLAAEELTGRWPATEQWATSIETLPGYGNTYPPHW